MIPDCPGGGTVSWTNPWGEHKYIEEIEAREDGGTPPFLQTAPSYPDKRRKSSLSPLNIAYKHYPS